MTIRNFSTALVVACGLALTSQATAQTSAQDAVNSVDPNVLALTATFNDEAIPFNDKLITLGKADAPLTSVLVFGLSADTTYFVNRILPRIIDKYVASGKMKLVVIDYPLTWHDMQVLAGFRCVPPDKHWDLLQKAVSYNRFAHNLKIDSFMNAPDHVWREMKDYGVSRETADKCMRNVTIVGHIEAQRQVVTSTWGTSTAPTFIVGDQVLVNPYSDSPITEAIEGALKGGK